MAAAVAEAWGLLPAGTFLLVSFFFVVTTKTAELRQTLNPYHPSKRNYGLLRESANLANEVNFSITIFKIISPGVKPPLTVTKQPRTSSGLRACRSWGILGRLARDEAPISSTGGNPCGSALFDAGIGVVVVDTLVIFRLHFEPRDVRMRIELHSHIANQVLNEHWVLIGSLRHRLLILSLEQ